MATETFNMAGTCPWTGMGNIPLKCTLYIKYTHDHFKFVKYTLYKLHISSKYTIYNRQFMYIQYTFDFFKWNLKNNFKMQPLFSTASCVKT